MTCSLFIECMNDEWMNKTREHSSCSELSRGLDTRLIHRLDCLRDLPLKGRLTSQCVFLTTSAPGDSLSISIFSTWPFWTSGETSTSWNLFSSWQPVTHRGRNLNWAWHARVCCSAILLEKSDWVLQKAAISLPSILLLRPPTSV